MKIKAFITHKLKESFSDCQDRFCINYETKSIALSDGMSESWHQKIWAKLLVEKYASNKDWVPTIASVKELSSEWFEEVKKFIQALKDKNAPENIIIRNENSLAEGRSAGATFVGIRFTDNEWDGDVLGDSCLIEWDGKDAEFHTSQKRDSFDSHPDYFDSDSKKEGRGKPEAIHGSLKQGTCILIVSDPFSDFLMKRKNDRDIATYASELLELTSHQEFEDLVERWRNKGMHNDDSTLIIIEPDETNELNRVHEDDLELMKLAELEAALQKEKQNVSNMANSTSLIEGENLKDTPNNETENSYQVGEPSLTVAKPENNSGSNLTKEVRLNNSVCRSVDSNNAKSNEQFIADFLKNLDEEFGKGKANYISRIAFKGFKGFHDLFRNKNVKSLIENALDRTLKNYDIRLKI
jgi:hypothetical protein